MMTAGMVKGTPDWQLDRIYESECAEAWEKENEPQPTEISRYSFESINRAWAALETAKSTFGLLESEICEALESIIGTPQSDKLASLYDTISDLALEVKEIRDELKTESHRAWEGRRFAG